MWRIQWTLEQHGFDLQPRTPGLHSWVYISKKTKTKTLIRKDTHIPIFIVALFTKAKTWKQPKCSSTDEWIKKMRCIYTMEYYSVIKRMNLAISENLDEIRGHYAK